MPSAKDSQEREPHVIYLHSVCMLIYIDYMYVYLKPGRECRTQHNHNPLVQGICTVEIYNKILSIIGLGFVLLIILNSGCVRETEKEEKHRMSEWVNERDSKVTSKKSMWKQR